MTFVFEEVKITREDIINCSYLRWADFFKGSVPPAKVFRPLPQAFLDYLGLDTIRLPKAQYEEKVVATSDNEYSDWEDDESQECSPVEAFQELHDGISSAVAEFGAVMVKFNWLAPKDARWILINNEMKCRSVNDVYLILNASDHIAHDIDYALSEAENHEELHKHDTSGLEYELVVKKWMDMNPALEFRVFVSNKRIIGISQRDLNHYNYLEALRPDIQRAIAKFWHHYNLSNTVFCNPSYVLDVYVPRPFTKVWVIDVNPFSRKCDPLLFTWHELTEFTAMANEPELRLVDETNVGRFAQKENSENQVPLEVVDAAANTEAMVELAKQWAKVGPAEEPEPEKGPDLQSEAESSP